MCGTVRNARFAVPAHGARRKAGQTSNGSGRPCSCSPHDPLTHRSRSCGRLGQAPSDLRCSGGPTLSRSGRCAFPHSECLSSVGFAYAAIDQGQPEAVNQIQITDAWRGAVENGVAPAAPCGAALEHGAHAARSLARPRTPTTSIVSSPPAPRRAHHGDRMTVPHRMTNSDRRSSPADVHARPCLRSATLGPRPSLRASGALSSPPYWAAPRRGSDKIQIRPRPPRQRVEDFPVAVFVRRMTTSSGPASDTLRTFAAVLAPVAQSPQHCAVSIAWLNDSFDNCGLVRRQITILHARFSARSGSEICSSTKSIVSRSSAVGKGRVGCGAQLRQRRDQRRHEGGQDTARPAGRLARRLRSRQPRAATAAAAPAPTMACTRSDHQGRSPAGSTAVPTGAHSPGPSDGMGARHERGTLYARQAGDGADGMGAWPRAPDFTPLARRRVSFRGGHGCAVATATGTGDTPGAVSGTISAAPISRRCPRNFRLRTAVHRLVQGATTSSWWGHRYTPLPWANSFGFHLNARGASAVTRLFAQERSRSPGVNFRLLKFEHDSVSMGPAADGAPHGARGGENHLGSPARAPCARRRSPTSRDLRRCRFTAL